MKRKKRLKPPLQKGTYATMQILEFRARLEPVQPEKTNWSVATTAVPAGAVGLELQAGDWAATVAEWKARTRRSARAMRPWPGKEVLRLAILIMARGCSGSASPKLVVMLDVGIVVDGG